jgi:tetratricopeptide (TPR) repeat protein
MTKNRSENASTPSARSTRSSRVPASDKVMSDLQRLLSEQDFDSAEDVNRFLQELLSASGGYIPEASPLSPLEQAQHIIYDAWESPTKAKRIKLAREALEISPDCADAYVLLAEENTKIPAEARAYYEQGLAAGERALQGKFADMRGHFWGHIETRPYMRARLGLARCLWDLGELKAAADHMGAMLKLNPNDNQGVRYLYISLLLELEDNRRLERLRKQYANDGRAHWRYGVALHEFRMNGPGGRVDKLLGAAVVCNPHVPPFLLGRKKVPKRTSGYYTLGERDEAVDYVLDGMRSWFMTEGALSWLSEFVDGHGESSPPASAPAS